MFGCFKLSEKAKIYKNFIAFNCATILTFAAYDTVASVSSVLNQDQSLGTTSQSIVYFVQFITALVWPQICIEVIGFKYTLVASQLCYLLFFFANAFPNWATIIPSNFFLFFTHFKSTKTRSLKFKPQFWPVSEMPCSGQILAFTLLCWQNAWRI